MQFEVKGQTYFLGALPPTGELVLVMPTRQGLRRIPIVHDDPEVLLSGSGHSSADEGSTVTH